MAKENLIKRVYRGRQVLTVSATSGSSLGVVRLPLCACSVFPAKSLFLCLSFSPIRSEHSLPGSPSRLWLPLNRPSVSPLQWRIPPRPSRSQVCMAGIRGVMPCIKPCWCARQASAGRVHTCFRKTPEKQPTWASPTREDQRRVPDAQSEQHERNHTRWHERAQEQISLRSRRNPSRVRFKAWPGAVAVWCDVIHETRRNQQTLPAQSA